MSDFCYLLTGASRVLGDLFRSFNQKKFKDNSIGKKFQTLSNYKKLQKSKNFQGDIRNKKF